MDISLDTYSVELSVARTDMKRDAVTALQWVGLLAGEMEHLMVYWMVEA